MRRQQAPLSGGELPCPPLGQGIASRTRVVDHGHAAPGQQARPCRVPAVPAVP